MTDLEQRLRDLGSSLDAGSPTATATLAARAGRRRRRRRVLGVGGAMAVLLVVVLGGRFALDDEAEQVVTGPPPTSEGVTAVPGQRSIGDVRGVTVEVSPNTGLVDGQLVTVRIEGLGELPGAALVMCRGDVEQASAAQLCDVDALSGGGVTTATSTQEVRVSRFLTPPGLASELDTARSVVDCANEPAGCVLAVGSPYATPLRGVIVPLDFTPARDAATPEVLVTPAEDLDAGSRVQVTAAGLRPNRQYQLLQCTADGRACSWEVSGSPDPPVVTDEEGRFQGTMAVSSVFFGTYGRVDCTVETCVVGVRELALAEPGSPVGLVVRPISFAPGTVAPVPELVIEPGGPYDDRQEVVVRGSGFPPGFDIGRWLGICPAHLDTAIEERCSYPLAFASVVVAPDGTFTTPVTLRAGTSVGGCIELPQGCVLAWVLNHGPMAATAPLPFS